MLATEHPRTGKTALWALGFRPFFLVAGVAALLLVPVWALQYGGASVLPNYYPSGMLWHGHEMLFGYTIAVIAGFLLTAVRNWTGRETASGATLAGLALLWLGGRVLPWFPAVLPAWFIALVDLAFAPTLAASLAMTLRGPGQAHNRRLLLILGLLTVANGLVHAQVLGMSAATAGAGLNFAVYLILVLITVIVGRVLPFFTQRAISNAKPRQWVWWERLTIAVTVLLAALLPWLPMYDWLAWLCLGAALLHGVRLAAWHDVRIWSNPMLWVLHLGYAWVAVGFLLLGLSAWGAGSVFIALHAFTAGAIGTLTLGMMARVALGHTGRDMRAHPATTLAFLVLTVAAVLRVLWPLFLPQHYAWAVMMSAICWALAFALFTTVYAPVLLRPRIDGRPG